jgi:hypothetical protein
MVRRLGRSPWLVLAAALLVAAAGCGIAAAATWRDPVLEGVYFNRSAGASASAGVYSLSEIGGRVWLGAAVGLAVAGTLVLAVSVAARRLRSGGAAAAPRA